MLLLYLRVDKFAQPVPAFKNISCYYYMPKRTVTGGMNIYLKTSYVTIIWLQGQITALQHNNLKTSYVTII